MTRAINSSVLNDARVLPTIRRLAVVTDAWHPQINGVVNTLSRVVKHLEQAGVARHDLFRRYLVPLGPGAVLWSSRASPMRMRVPWITPSQSDNPGLPSTMMVEPCRK